MERERNKNLNVRPDADDPSDENKVDQPLPDLGENYEVLEEIGHGGMGTVFKVVDKQAQQTFAIKVLRKDLALNQGAVKRFEQEVKAASELNHSNLAAIYGHGITSDNTPYMVMDYLEGMSLADKIKKDGKLDIQQSLEMFEQISNALIHAHEMGIIHRDLKPSNIILSKNESGELVARVVDFGIAKVLTQPGSETLTGLTQTGDIFGSPLYMSPEQCQGERLDARSDVYAMGCVMYESLTGNRLFKESNNFKVMMKHVNEGAPIIEDEHVGLALKSIVSKCLEKDPALRYQTVNELLEDIVRVKKNETLKHADAIKTSKRLRKQKAASTKGTKSLAGKPHLWIGLAIVMLTVLVVGVPMIQFLFQPPPPAKVSTRSSFPNNSEFADIDPNSIDVSVSDEERKSWKPIPEPVYVKVPPAVSKPIVTLPAVPVTKIQAAPLQPSALTSTEKARLRELLYSVSEVNRLSTNPIVEMGPRVLPDLIEGLSNTDVGYARNCSIALRSFGQQPLPQLLTLFKEESGRWVGDAIEAVGDPGLLALAPNLIDSDPALRARTSEVLKHAFNTRRQLGQQNVPLSKVSNLLLWMMLNDENSAARSAAAGALLYAPDVPYFDKALTYTMISDRAAEVRLAAANVLMERIKRSGDFSPPALQAIGYFIQNEDPVSSRVRLLSDLTYQAFPSKSILPYIRGAYHKGDDSVKERVLQTVSAMGQNAEEALPEIEDALNNSQMRYSAVSALERIGPRGKQLLPRLKDILVLTPRTRFDNYTRDAIFKAIDNIKKHKTHSGEYVRYDTQAR